MFHNLAMTLFSLLYNYADSFPSVTGESFGMQNFYIALNWFLDFLIKLDFILPVDTMFTVIGVTIGFEIFMIVAWCINYILRIIRGM